MVPYKLKSEAGVYTRVFLRTIAARRGLQGLYLPTPDTQREFWVR